LLGLVRRGAELNNCAINLEATMDSSEFEELAGRIDGVARAVMHLAAMAEMHGVIDGPRMSGMWRGALVPQAQGALAASHRVLQEMADRLDAAREVRRSRASR